MGYRNGRRSRKLVHCRRSQNIKPHEARHLCKCCYNRVIEGRAGRESIDDYPPAGRAWNPVTPDRTHQVGNFHGAEITSAGLTAGHKPVDMPHRKSKAEHMADKYRERIRG